MVVLSWWVCDYVLNIGVKLRYILSCESILSSCVSSYMCRVYCRVFSYKVVIFLLLNFVFSLPMCNSNRRKENEWERSVELF